MSDPSPSLCPTCGAPLDAGPCPRCLMVAAMVPTSQSEEGSRQPPPSLETVAAAFPQLEILELIGHGGMGVVYKARQPKLHRLVALKLLPASLAERDPAFAGRFEREGQLLARLHHPNIVAVHDSGIAGEFFYLIMEFVDGVNLRQAMRTRRFSPAQALSIVPHICDALQYAHDEGVLHRDIKPENVLLDAKGRVKLVDFGIAKLLADVDPPAADTAAVDTGLTQSGTALGTPSYMAPEQRETPANIDHRADIYSLGVVFYELLTGELPRERFAPPSAKSDADPRVDAIVQQALEKERDRRQSSAGEVKTQVESVAKTPQSVVQKPGAHRGRRRWSIATIVVLVSVVAMSGAALFIPLRKIVTERNPQVESSAGAIDSGRRSPESWSYTPRYLTEAKFAEWEKAAKGERSEWSKETSIKHESGVIKVTGPRERVRLVATMLRVLDQPEVKDALELPILNMPPEFFLRIAWPSLIGQDDFAKSPFTDALRDALKRENVTAPQLARALSAHVLELEKATFVNSGTPFENIIRSPGASTFYDATIPCADQPDKPLTLRIERTTQQIGTQSNFASFAPWLIEEAKKQSKEPLGAVIKGAAKK